MAMPKSLHRYGILLYQYILTPEQLHLEVTSVKNWVHQIRDEREMN
jgi:hypothetical protein